MMSKVIPSPFLAQQPVLPESDFKSFLLSGQYLIDIRAPVEFTEGALPLSVNLPILENDERVLVGTAYKQLGSQAAIQLGFELVSNENKQIKLQKWKDFIEQNPGCVLTCFRGGLRSQITQAWLSEIGLSLVRIDGGYKKLRNFCLQVIQRTADISVSELPFWLVVSGATGSGKTLLLREIATQMKTCDLEKAAHHRGSAFGSYGDFQPSQASFENDLAIQLLRASASASRGPLLVEDESRLIGRSVQPDLFFERLRQSPVVILDEPLSCRVEITFQDYILESEIVALDSSRGHEVYLRYRSSVQKISKKLGGLRTQQVLVLLDEAWKEQLAGHGPDAHRQWIEVLLRDYYDPMYLGSLAQRNPSIQFRGTRQACLQYLLSLRS